MKLKTQFRQYKAVDGRIIYAIEEEGKPLKLHNVTGPAVIYPTGDSRSNEYHLNGIKYDKDKWAELTSPLRKSRQKDDFNI